MRKYLIRKCSCIDEADSEKYDGIGGASDSELSDTAFSVAGGESRVRRNAFR